MRPCVDPERRQHTFWRLRWGRKILVSKTDLIYPKEDGLQRRSRQGEHYPFDIRASSGRRPLLLVERKKKRDEEDLQAALASIKVK